MENNLPQGWVAIPPFEIAYKIRGVSYNKDEISFTSDDGLIPVLRANNIDDNKLVYNDLVYVPLESISENQLLEKGDVIIAMSSGSKNLVGKAAQYFDEGKIAFGTFCGVLRPTKEINQKYFGYYFQSKEYRNIISELSAGTNINNLKNEYFAVLQIPLPPFHEQHRIVAKLDALMGKIESNKQRLDKIPVLLKHFRQSVLATAVNGRLTEDWREDDGYSEIENLSFEIPVSWRTEVLKKLASKVTYGSSQKSEITGKVPVLRMGNIQDGKITWDDLKYSSNDEEIKKYNLEKGAVLFNRTNSPELVGKTAIYKGERKAIYAGYLIKVKTNEKLSADYLNICLNTVYAREWCNQVKTDGVSQSNINAQKLGEFILPHPSINEQTEIVQRVEQLFALADKIEARYAKAKAMLDKLSQSILAKAFRGELVPQNPGDEPASVLLERIRIEKEKLNITKKPKREKKRVKI